VSEPYHLVIKAQARRALEHQLSPSTAFAVWEFIAGPLAGNPQRVGKQLVSPPFQGDWSARRGHYRVRYQIDDEKHAIIVIDIADRSDIYHPGRK
jgi:mRNA interferase RelE/StbE